MEYFDPTFLHMILILPSLFGLSLLYEGAFKKREGEKGWFLYLASGTLVLISVGFLLVIFRSL